LFLLNRQGYKPGEKISLGLWIALSEFYNDGIYDYTNFEGESAAKRTSKEQPNICWN